MLNRKRVRLYYFSTHGCELCNTGAIFLFTSSSLFSGLDWAVENFCVKLGLMFFPLLWIFPKFALICNFILTRTATVNDFNTCGTPRIAAFSIKSSFQIGFHSLLIQQISSYKRINYKYKINTRYIMDNMLIIKFYLNKIKN